MKKHIRAFVSLLCAAALALGCASCGGAAQSTGKSGGTAVVTLTAPVEDDTLRRTVEDKGYTVTAIR